MKAKTGPLHAARKQLFSKGVREGRLTAQEIDAALPPGSSTGHERWLLFYSLKLAEVAIVDAGASKRTG